MKKMIEDRAGKALVVEQIKIEVEKGKAFHFFL